jgi:PAS domain S-box-containing protein
MSFRPWKPRTSSDGRASVRVRVVLLLIAFVVVTAGVLAGLLIYLRDESIASAERVLSAFAQLTDEQTTRTIQDVDQTLEIAEERLASAARAGTANEESVRIELNSLLASRPFLSAITVLDRHGRFLYRSEGGGEIGLDVSDRDYFINHKDDPKAGFLLSAPIRARATREWIIPATRTWHDSSGGFAGVIVGSIDPLYFNRIWVIDKAIQDQATALWRNDGTVLLRTPLAEGTMRLSLTSGAMFARIKSGSESGTLRTVSLMDGKNRLVAYRRLAAYPTLTLGVTQATDRVLAGWWRIVWFLVVGWAAGTTTLGVLLLWLAHVWDGRRAMAERYGFLFKLSPYPMFVVDRETRRILAVSDATVDYYGWSQAELHNMNVDDLYLPEDLPTARARRKEYGPGPTRLNEVLRHRKKDGTIVDVEATVRLIDFESRPATMAMVQDVTARKAAERHVVKVEGQYRGLLEAAPDAMVVVNQAGEIVLVNVQAEKQFGYPRDELLGQKVTNIIPEGFAERLVTDATRSETDALAQEIGTGIELLGRRKDRSMFPIEIMLSPLESADGLLVTAAIRNISVRKAAEDTLRQSQKMETVGQLTGGVAHDFNNILHVIVANTDMLLEDEHLSADSKDHLGHIDKAVQRASTLTSQLLAYSRKQPLRPQQTDLTDLVTETGTLLKRALGAQIEIESVLSDDLCVANVDRSQLQTALVNLCINARDAMPDGGRLLIETHNTVLNEEDVAPNTDATAGIYAMIAVTDTGDGIPPETLAKVFEPFFTTKEVGKGTGLGLSMVYGFIKQSNGHVRIYSEVGKGTSVKLYLPCSGKTAEVALSRDTAPMAGGIERILVVEDEPQVRASVMQQLQSLGYAVSEAADGAAGVAACEAAPLPYALLLTDVVMPGLLNGKALASEVARRWPKTKIVFMSGFTEASSMRHGRLDEGSLLLSKPFRKRDLARVVRTALDATRPLPG